MNNLQKQVLFLQSFPSAVFISITFRVSLGLSYVSKCFFCIKSDPISFNADRANF